ncbi:MAG: peptide ABC transporter substrate-binding protein [Anaerolineales bacterium]|nr:peptide ABC transporter substrate-binding protein [Anaerolineales bacterium]
MPRNRWIWIPLTIVVVAFLLVACGGGILFLWYQGEGVEFLERLAPSSESEPSIRPTLEAKPPTQLGATLNLPGGEPPTLDPALTQDATSATYIVEIFSGLVTLSRDLEIVPDIADSWELSDDSTTYTFHLRDDVKFHDGKPVTAQDFKYSIERACDPATGSVVADTYLGDIVGAQAKLRGQADEVSGVLVVDDHTLEITIDSPKAYFLSKLTYPTAFVVDQENVEGPAQPWTDKPNGTGPFRLAEYELGLRIVLERNEAYYGTPKPALDRVNFLLAGGSAMTMYETGELDAVPVGLADIERVSDPSNPLNEELSVTLPMLSIFYIGFNVEKPPFDDQKVRQAFNYAIDKDKYVEVVWKKMQLKADGILPPGMPGHNENLQGYPYDPEKARQLITESKYGDASNLPEITLNVSGGGGAADRQVSAIVEMYKQNLGVDIAIQQTEWATYLWDLRAHRYQMFGLTAGWIADYPDPQNFLDILFHSESHNNYWKYSNPEVDRLLEEARGEQDSEKRMELYQQAEEMILEDAPIVPLTHAADYWLTKPYVEGMIYPPVIIPKLKYVSIGK